MIENEIKIGKNYFGLIRFYTIEYRSEKSFNNLFGNFFQDENDKKNGKLDIASGLLANLTFVEKKEGCIFVKSKLSANIYTLALLLLPLMIGLLVLKFEGFRLDTIALIIFLLSYTYFIFDKIIYEEHIRIKNYIISKLYEIQ